jgi:hypothetical protein
MRAARWLCSAAAVATMVWLAIPQTPGLLAQAASAPTITDVDSAIRVIQDAPNAQAAIAAYARGCSVNRGIPALHEAYLRRMLQFGQPKFANGPARVLLASNPTHPMANAVGAYVHVRTNALARALAPALIAASQLPANESVAANAGQLMAWYEKDSPDTVLSDEARGALARIKTNLSKTTALETAYRRICRAFDERERELEGLKAQILKIQAEANDLYSEGQGIDAQLKDLDEKHKDAVSRLADQRQAVDNYENYPENDPTWERRKSLYQSITEDAALVDKLAAEYQAVRQAGLALRRRLDRKLAEVRGLERSRDQARLRYRIDYDWQPPAVDGVVTPEASMTASSGGSAPQPPADEADSKLKLARLYLQNGMEAKAIAMLQQLIANYPDTPAAKTARKQLADLTGKTPATAPTASGPSP